MITLKVGSPSKTVWISCKAARGYRFRSKLGSGAAGTVYHASPPSGGPLAGPDVAIKVQITRDDDGETFQEEANLAKRMSDLGAGPRFLGAWIAEGVGFLVTDKWDMSLLDYQRNSAYPEKDRKKLADAMLYKLKILIKRLHDANYVHGDILEKNILVKVSPYTGELTDIVLTDFGLMHTIPDWKLNEPFMQTMLDYHAHTLNRTHYYVRDKKITLDDLLKDPRHLDVSLVYFFNRQRR